MYNPSYKVKPTYESNNLIPCDECGKNIDFTQYESHMAQHKNNIKKKKEAESINAKIPCDVCREEISFEEYQLHMAINESSNDTRAKFEKKLPPKKFNPVQNNNEFKIKSGAKPIGLQPQSNKEYTYPDRDIFDNNESAVFNPVQIGRAHV